MKIKYTCKNIEVNLKTTRIFCKVQTNEERDEFIQLAESLGYSASLNVKRKQTPVALFIGQRGEKRISQGDVKYKYIDKPSPETTYTELSIETFRKLMKDECIKKE